MRSINVAKTVLELKWGCSESRHRLPAPQIKTLKLAKQNRVSSHRTGRVAGKAEA